MKQFVPKRQFFLDEMLRRDGRGDFTAEKCCSCPDASNARPASIRCMSCFPGPLLCEKCTVSRHTCTPYHRLKLRPPFADDFFSDVYSALAVDRRDL